MTFDPRRFHVFLRPEPGRSYGMVKQQVACSTCMTVVQTVDDGVDLATLLQGAEQHCQGPHREGGQR